MNPRRAFQLAVFLCLAHAAQAVTYYVNDSSTNGDVYCSAVGDSGNSGATFASPKATLQQILDAYSLTNGDTVYVDTGTYAGETTTFGLTDQGAPGSLLTVQGSTNYGAGGTVFDRQSNTVDVVSIGASYVRLADLRLRGGRYGLYLAMSKVGCEFERVFSVSNTYGFYDEPYTGARFIRCAAVKNTYGYRANTTGSKWDQGVSWSNTYAFQFEYDPAPITISNSVIVGGTAFSGVANLPGVGDHNVFWNITLGGAHQNLSDLQRARNSWWRSTYADPQFADAENLDFHPRSTEGRYNLATRTWVTDAVTSVLIDLGNPVAVYANEPLPNGSRMDVGVYGNSAEASKSPTNAPYLFAISFNDGGTLLSTGMVCWAYRNFPTNGTVKLDYSRDRGATWINIVTNVLVTNGYYIWNASAVTSTPIAYWRVVSEADGGVFATNAIRFVLKGTNDEIRFYVNDTNIINDVYCGVPGSPTNDGLSASRPKLRLQDLMEEYDLGPNDTVYVDTGFYPLTNTVTMDVPDQGASGNRMTIQGSTNYAAGGSLFDRQSAGSDVLAVYGSYVRLADLRLRGGRYGLYLATSKVGCEFERVFSISNTYGFYDEPYTGARFIRCAAVKNTYGYRANTTGSKWDQGVSWSNTYAFQFEYDPAPITISNSVIVGGTVFSGVANLPGVGDHNVFWNVTWGGGYLSLIDLQRAKNSWWHSTYADPQFADADNLDFHPRSTKGRYNLATRTWVTDAVTSVLIDLGNPVAVYANEPLPNGSRMDVGVYGNSVEASKSPTNSAYLFALSYNDGGTLWYTGTLYWVSRNFPSNGAVRLDYSRDRGSSWVSIATNVPATNGYCAWDASAVTSSPVAYWRVISEANPAIADTNEHIFVLKGTNEVIRYYVNDSSTNGDVYCTAVGNSTNDGFFPFSPKLSGQEIFNEIDLGPADIVYVDTGLYVLTNTITVSVADQGASNNVMTIQGSTNYAAGGSVLDRQSAASDVMELNAPYVRLADFRLIGGRYGLHVNGAYCEFDRLYSISNSYGFYDEPSTRSLFTRCAAIRNGVGYRANTSDSQWNMGLSWSNGIAFRLDFNPYPVTISNSVIVGGTVFSGSSAQPAYGDYNLLWNATLGLDYPSLNEMQKAKGSWWHSTVADPLFVDAPSFDFHPKSVVGAYSNGSWVVYSNHSPCIDFGDPAAAYSNEPSPNGSNVNIGIYGNTREASMSRTNAWLQVLNYSDGGILNVPGDKLYWMAGNYPAGSKVTIQFSGDSGVSWLTVVTNLAASDGMYTWANTNFDSSRFGRWRVFYESDTNNYSATSAGDFTLRNGPYNYFVNDNSSTGDIYTTVIGNNGNLGVTSNTPKASVQAILNAYVVEPGDTIYIDTGNYYLTYEGPIRITAFDCGTNGNPVVIQGSTNYLFGGTVFDRGHSGTPVFSLDPVNGPVQDVTVRDIALQGGSKGLTAASATRIRLERVTTRLNREAGFDLLNCSTVVLSRCVARNMAYGLAIQGTTPVYVDRSVFCGNSNAAVQVVSGLAFVSNSVLWASGSSAYLYLTPAATNIVGDYNDLYADGNALVGCLSSFGRNLDTLSAWSAVSTQEVHSLSVDPLFADRLREDFHLKTQTLQGRFDPLLGWVNDSETSLLIDSGDPAAVSTYEPAGTRLDIGFYGNTAEASKGRTNFWLLAASHQAGGWTKGATVLHWVAGNSTGGTVRVEVSTDGGNRWSVLTNGVPVTNEVVTWDTTTTNNTPAALWGVFSTSDSNVFDRTTNFVGIRNGVLDLFVNDSSTSGDIYCAAAGAATNWVASSNEPIDSLATAFSRYDIEPGDRVFVDTGTYTNNPANIEIGRSDGGMSGAVVQVLGSTNDFAGGSLFDRQATGVRSYGLRVDAAQWICLSNVTLKGGDTGVYLTNSANIALSVRSMSNASNGFEVVSSTGVSLDRCVAADNAQEGIYCRAATGVRVLNSVIWSNLGGGVYLNGGSVGVSNSVITASGPEHFVYEIVGTNDLLTADYNDALCTDDAWFAKKVSTIHKYLSSWQEATTNDIHSLSHDPLFANATTGDFHLKSQAGRYEPGVGIVTDMVSSVLIDAGNPIAAFNAEPAPNGNCLNVGLYGNTAQESRSRTNGWLVALTLNSGGLTRGTNYIYWMAGGAATGMQVYVDYSADGGVTWSNIATNVFASTYRVLWNTFAFQGSSFGKWRVTSQSDPTVWDDTDSYFALKNEPLGYYVNDASTNGDVYTTAPGDAANDGLRPSTPKSSIQGILNSYILEQGDRVLVDTGTYNLTNSLTINNVVSGVATNLMVIQGSTNEVAGGTLLNRQGGLWGIEIRGARGIGLLDLRITNAACGVYVYQSTNCVIDRLRVDSPGVGFEIRQSTTNAILHSLVNMFTGTGVLSMASTGTKCDGDAFVMTHGTTGVCVVAQGGDVTVSNSVLGADGLDSRLYHIRVGASLASDYNDLYITNGATVATDNSILLAPGMSDTVYDNVSRWARDTGRDRHSLSCSPGVADPSGGDFHLLSQGGRYVVSNGTFVIDDQTSALIDAGDPWAGFTNEPAPDGMRINIGPHGNTAEASKTPTNGFFTVVSLNDGGRAEGTNWMLYWVAHGMATGHLVRLEFSADAGFSWATIDSNVLAGNGFYFWNTTPFSNTVRGLWKITSQSDTNLTAGSDKLFAVRNASIDFYVNDGATNGDVYTSATGNPTNSGLTPSAPKASLQEILDAYDLEGGDTVYVDTGQYSNTVDTVIGQLDAGDGISRLAVQGSTNNAAGGTVFKGFGIQAVNTRGVELKNLKIQPTTARGVDIGVELFQATNSVIEWVSVEGGNCGFKVDRCQLSEFRHCTAAGVRTNGIECVHDSEGTIWDSGVLWSNSCGLYAEGGTVSVSNSVVGVFGSGHYAYTLGGTVLNSDHNAIFLTNGAYVASEWAGVLYLDYDSVSRWARDTGRDAYTLNHDPGFVSPANGDFHPLSCAGHYVVSNDSWAVDGTTSILIDAGDPSLPYASEPGPNGSRINIGLYGNTAEASKTPTNASLTLLALSDGGRAEGTNYLLNWVARGDATGHLVRIDFSPDGGVTWQSVVANLAATNRVYSWNTTLYTSTVRGVLIITSQNDTNIFDRSQRPFAIRNSPISFYVNDASTNGDVYTQAPGAITNLGLVSSEPMASLQAILSAYDLESNDTVYVDTGAYTNSAEVFIGQLDSANSNSIAPVVIRGSTNYAAGGTVLDRNGGYYGIRLYQALGVSIRDLSIRNASVGVQIYRSLNVELDHVDVQGGSRGFDVQRNTEWACVFRRCLARGVGGAGLYASGAADVQWINGILWSNSQAGVYLDGGSATIRNSVIGAFGPGRYAYYVSSGAIDADYNDIFITNGAFAAYRSASPVPLIYQNVSRWVRGSTQDVHSLSHAPGFFSPGTGDFHLQSQAGRYAVTSGTFVVDTSSSLLIDAGDPESAYAYETTPNGFRVNIGLFGNTSEASRTPTNATLTVCSLNDGGRVEGPSKLLSWIARGDATGHMVRVEFSPDAGSSWQTVATDLPADRGICIWNTLSFPSTMLGLWRVVSQNDTNVFDVADSLFALRNHPLAVYVNDGILDGDVYTSALGDPTNSGAYSWAPKDSIQAILDKFDVEPGDTIYVDTGNYLLSSPITVGQFDSGARSGASADHVAIQGSTNDGAGGSVFTSPFGGNGILLENASGVDLRYLTIRNASVGLLAQQAPYSSAEFVRCEHGAVGFSLVDSPNFLFMHCVAWDNSERGVSSAGTSRDVVWDGGVLWSNLCGVYVYHTDINGAFTLRNSVFGSFGEGRYTYFLVRGALTTDYNNIYLHDGAFAGAVMNSGFLGGGTSRYPTVASWMAARGQDVHTLTFDPRFADIGAGDFHLKSGTGRYVPGMGWTNDSISSVLIDSGSPKSGWTNECIPNGGRINIDLYGNTWQASKTPTNGWLSIITLNDGGAVKGTNIELRWFAGWVATGHVLRLEYSPDAGVTWTNIISNSPPSITSYIWDSVLYGKSAISKWRITSVDDPSVSCTSEGLFVLRNGGTIPYYVNDTSTVGDVYTRAIGSSANSGLFSNAPKDSIQGILDAYTLEARDTIYVDTGVYALDKTITIDDLDSGSATGYVVYADGSSNVAHVIVQGSTNYASGGSVIVAPSALKDGIALVGSPGIELRDLRIHNGLAGVSMSRTVGCLVERVQSYENKTGFRLDNSLDARFVHSSLFLNTTNGLENNQSSLSWENGVIWDNPNPLVLGKGSVSAFRNTAVKASGSGQRIFSLAETAAVTNTDYNNLIRENGALVAERQRTFGGSEIYNALFNWQNEAAQDGSSLSHDPLFADEAGGDFHPRSVPGRWVPGFGYTNDTVHSPLIDAGDPTSSFTNETVPNGARVNIGQYGDTSESSLSRTNPWLLAVSFNDRPTISGTNFLRWFYGGMTNGTRVRLEATLNDGVTYSVLASNVPMSSSTGFVWDVWDVPLAVNCRWRVISESDVGVEDEVDASFAIKNQILTIYVNDGFTNGDVYCTAIGNPLNTGTNASSPLDEPAAALYKYPLGRGDTIYVDTGVYTITSEVGLVLNETSRGEEGFPVTIHGSTNKLAGGTVINRADTNGIGLLVSNSRFIDVDHLDLRGGRIGVQYDNSLNCSFVGVRCSGNGQEGFSINSGRSVTFDRCAAWGNKGWGVSVDGTLTEMEWARGIVWSNSSGGIALSHGTLSVSNSIIHSPSNRYLYAVGLGVIHGNFNCLWPEDETKLMRDPFHAVDYTTFKEWQENKGVDEYSVMVDPLFADPANGDFHLQSQAGRYSSGSFVIDPVTSWAIDAGDFAADFSGEPSPNGNRLNIGVDGNTREASKSLTSNPALLAVSLNDGGVVRDSQLLYWLSRGMSPTSRLRIDFLSRSGAEWQTIATDLSVTQQGYLWTPTNPPTPVARWRVMDQANTNIFDIIDVTFLLPMGPIYYYVNDASTNGDIYSAGPGSPTSSGLLTNEPQSSIQYILDKYDLGRSDAIFVDTGVYVLTNGVEVGINDGGVLTSRVSIVGSTNWIHGGSVLRMSGPGMGMGGTALHLHTVDGVALDHLIVENADVGLSLERSRFCLGRDLLIRDGGRAGIMETYSDSAFERTVVTRFTGAGISLAQSSADLQGCVIWSNRSHAALLSGAYLVVSNSVLHASGPTNVCYHAFTNGTIVADYNDLYAENGANIAIYRGGPVERLAEWTVATTQDTHSLTFVPLFADTASDDYHLRSETGRFDPATRTFVATDTNTSWLIDTGFQNASCTNEPMPNGGRLNIGVHGNTTEASKSRTNAWLLAITGSGGGRLEGYAYLAWAWGSIDSTNRVRLDYSYDNGSNWMLIVESQSITNGQYLWNSAEKVAGNEKFPSSPLARWRLVLESDTNTLDVTDSHFALRNKAFVYCVNDTNFDAFCDIYTTAPGDDNNLGIFSNAPKATLKSLLATLDVEGGDVILIDAGVYPVTNTDPTVVTVADQGKLGNPVVIRGNTNCTSSVFDRASYGLPSKVLSVQASYMSLQDLSVRGGHVEILGQQVIVTNILVTNGDFYLGGRDSLVSDARVYGGDVEFSTINGTMSRIVVLPGTMKLGGLHLLLQNSVIYNTNNSPALRVSSGEDVTVRNNTIISRGTAFRQEGLTSLSTLTNNILVADGSRGGDVFCIQVNEGILHSDYNDLVARNGAWIGNSEGNWERLLYWRRASGRDTHSLSHEPLFADEAGLDFHPKSIAGRYLNGSWTNDAVHSPAIDTGDPLAAYGNEPLPNGGRANMGAYGNSARASKSQTNAWLLAITMNDGGVLKGTNMIQWTSGNLGTSDLVRLEYSPDNGATWTNIATGLSALAHEFAWDTTAVTSSLEALWRVVLQTNPPVADQVDNLFAVRNRQLNFYVNDGVTNGDVYTSAAGSSGNDGLAPATPKDSIMGILNAYDTESRDTIYVDTGHYAVTSDVRVIWSHGGDDDYGNLLIQGSTNAGAGGSIITRVGGDGFDVPASHVTLRDFTVQQAYRGIFFESNRFNSVERMFVLSNSYGVVEDATRNTTNRNIRLWDNKMGGMDILNARTTVVENCDFVANSNFSFRIRSSVNNILQNNIFYVRGTNSTALAGDAGVLDNTFIDYNLYYFEQTSSIYASYRDLMTWQLAKGHDFRSAITNPLFANLPAGDFHLKSTGGRYLDGYGWTSDVQSSWGIDKGNPSSSYDLEPITNGNRINVGAFGNTEYASRSSTNFTVYCRVLNSPQFIGEGNSRWPLVWTAINVPPWETFRVQYSGDGGTNWVDLATNINSYNEYFIWQTTPYYNTYKGRWRVVGESNTNYWDMSDANFNIFYGVFDILAQRRYAGLNEITWRGAWDETYQVQYTTNRMLHTNGFVWINATDGTGSAQKAYFRSSFGGDLTYQDPESTNQSYRLYRATWWR